MSQALHGERLSQRLEQGTRYEWKETLSRNLCLGRISKRLRTWWTAKKKKEFEKSAEILLGPGLSLCWFDFIPKLPVFLFCVVLLGWPVLAQGAEVHWLYTPLMRQRSPQCDNRVPRCYYQLLASLRPVFLKHCFLCWNHKYQLYEKCWRTGFDDRFLSYELSPSSTDISSLLAKCHYEFKDWFLTVLVNDS